MQSTAAAHAERNATHIALKEQPVALQGRAFLAIWHDIAPEGEAEYIQWHTRQHMPERLGVPGFLVGRRYVNWALEEHRWFTLYEAATLETFSSDGYRARLNKPTQWTTRVQPHFRNFTRSACILSASVGCGMGGAMATLRLELDPGHLAQLEAGAESLAHRLATLPGIVGIHVGVAAPETTKIETRESALRGSTGEDVFDAVVLLDATGSKELSALLSQAQALLQAEVPIRSIQGQHYDLSFHLTSSSSR